MNAKVPEPDTLDDILWQHRPYRYRATFGCLGMRVVVRSTHGELLDMTRRSFGRFKSAPNGAPTVRLDLVGPPDHGSLLSSGTPVPSGAPLESGGASDRSDFRREIGRVIHREREAAYVATDGLGSIATADLAGGEVVVFVASGVDPRVLRSVLIESPVWRFAAYHGMTALHAAGIVIDGQSLVLRGLSGAGKSTLALAAALAGHTVLAEEVTWVDLAHHCLRGDPWTVRVEADALDFFPPLGTPREGADGHPPLASVGTEASTRTEGLPAPDASPDGSLAIDLAALGARTCESAPLGPLVFLERQRDGEARLAALSPHAARAAFKRTLLPGESTQRTAQLKSARDALLNHGAWLLAFSEPHAALRKLESLAAETL